MILPLIIYRSLRQHLFSTVITASSIALAGALLMAVWIVREESRAAFTGMSGGYDAVLGPRSSKLQLILNAVFHLEQSPGTLTLAEFELIKTNPAIELAVPLAMGDNYKGFRVVGTSLDFFAPSQRGQFVVRPPGRLFDPEAQEAVVGSYVAERLKIKRGDTIHPYHGLLFNEADQHAESYVVVGILEPSNTPADRVIWIPLAGLQHMSGHAEETTDEISAVLLRIKGSSAMAARQLDTKYNKEETRLTFAWPIAQTVAQLFDKIAWFDRVLELVSYLVALVAIASVVASIYTSLAQRRRDIAIFRALGARKRTIWGLIISEAAVIAGIGAVVGWVLTFVILGFVSQIIRKNTGVVLDPLKFHPVLVLAPIFLVLTSALAAAIPAWRAYGTDVARNLTPIS